MPITPPKLLRELFATLALFTCAHAQTHITIRNDLPRRDTTGAIVDAHDGNLQFFNGRYYLYGTSYGHTAGFSINNRFRAYSSADLRTWRYEGELLASPPDGVYYRPYVIYNQTTRKYVLWYNWYPRLWNGRVGVATSDTPTGPFHIQNPDVQLSNAKDRPGDGSPFVDDDGTAYFIYTVIGLGHSIFVERLSADYLSSTGQRSDPLAKGCEAPALFHRGNTYYALFDATCCFCQAGSGARVYTAPSPLGPYTLQSNINRDPSGTPVIHAQQTSVAKLPSPSGPIFLWMADRWGSRPDSIKGHDFQYWLPLGFSPTGVIDPLQPSAQWSATITSGHPSPPNKHPYTWPQKPDPNPVTIDPCTRTALNPVEQGVILQQP